MTYSRDYKKVWLTRGKPSMVDRRKQFVEEGLYAIGWSGTGSLKGKNRDDILDILNDPNAYKSKEPNPGMTSSMINCLVNDFQIGDYLVMPEDNTIHIGEVIGDYYYNKDKADDDYAHQIKVKWITNFSRDALPEKLRNSLRAGQTIADLSHHIDTIEDILPKHTEVKENNENYINVEYRLSQDETINLSLPNYMTKQEAERLGKFVSTLYFED